MFLEGGILETADFGWSTNALCLTGWQKGEPEPALCACLGRCGGGLRHPSTSVKGVMGQIDPWGLGRLEHTKTQDAREKRSESVESSLWRALGSSLVPLPSASLSMWLYPCLRCAWFDARSEGRSAESRMIWQ